MIYELTKTSTFSLFRKANINHKGAGVYGNSAFHEGVDKFDVHCSILFSPVLFSQAFRRSWQSCRSILRRYLFRLFP
jgi:hypothetical protein